MSELLLSIEKTEPSFYVPKVKKTKKSFSNLFLIPYKSKFAKDNEKKRPCNFSMRSLSITTLFVCL